MKIGLDASFYHLHFQWTGDLVRLTRQDDYVTEIADVIRIEEEVRRLEESEQNILLLRFHDRHGRVRTLFIDNDPVQTNVREIASELDRLDNVFAWLLPLDYVYRQGDVGLYRRTEIPVQADKISTSSYADRFIEVLSKRHSLDPVGSCEFYSHNDKFYVHVIAPVRLNHPEHESISLETGIYELIGARGTPLPEFVGLRTNEKPALER